MHLVARVALALGLTMLTRSALAGELSFGANDLETLFYISKSDGPNRVDYGMRLDSNCAPYGDEPVFPYWRESGPPPARLRPLGTLSKLGYGISTQSVVKRTASGGETTVQLRQVARTIFIKTSRGEDGRCKALVRTKIGRVPYAELLSIFVKLSGPLSVSYIDIKGKNLQTSKLIQERLTREPPKGRNPN